MFFNPASSVSTTTSNITVSAKVAGVANDPELDEEIEVYSLILFDQQTFEGQSTFKWTKLVLNCLCLVAHVYQLSDREHVTSITSCSFSSQDNANGRSVYVVGTAFVNPQDSEPTKGRILTFQVSDGTLHTHAIALH